MKEVYTLTEYRWENGSCKIIYESKFKQDVEIMKLRYEAANPNGFTYILDNYRTNRYKKMVYCWNALRIYFNKVERAELSALF